MQCFKLKLLLLLHREDKLKSYIEHLSKMVSVPMGLPLRSSVLFVH